MWALRGGNHPAQQDAVWLSCIAQKCHNRTEHFQPPLGLTFRLIKDAFVFCSLLRENASTHGQKLMVAWSEKCSWKFLKKKIRGNSDLDIHICIFYCMSPYSCVAHWVVNAAFVPFDWWVTVSSVIWARKNKESLDQKNHKMLTSCKELTGVLPYIPTVQCRFWMCACTVGDLAVFLL